MKKTTKHMVKAIVLVSLVVIVGGCGKKNTKLTIELEENPTTGYTWVYTIASEEIAEMEEDEYQAEDKGKTGAGGIHSYVIKGLKEGETSIEFVSKRDWEGGETGESKTYDIVVDKNLNVSEK